MTDKPSTNALITRAGAITNVHPEGYWRQRLQAHCDLANQYRWVRASGNPYTVEKDKDGVLAIGREGERKKASADSHYGRV